VQKAKAAVKDQEVVANSGVRRSEGAATNVIVAIDGDDIHGCLGATRGGEEHAMEGVAVKGRSVGAGGVTPLAEGDNIDDADGDCNGVGAVNDGDGDDDVGY